MKPMNRPYVAWNRRVPGVYQRCQDTCADPCKIHHWAYMVELKPGPDGKRRQVTDGGFRTGAEAKAARERVVEDDRRGLLPEQGGMTVRQWLTQWLQDRTEAVRPSTHRSYSDHVRLYLIPRLGNVKLADLRPDHVTTMLRTIRQERDQERAAVLAANAKRTTPVGVPRQIKPTTLQRIHATLRVALNAAMRRGYVTRNVATLAEVPRGTRARVQPWQPSEARAFLAYLDQRDPRLAPLVRVAMALGLRRGEACGLTWSQVDLDRGTVTVDRQLTAVGYDLAVTAPKSHESRRTVDMDAGTVKALKHWRAVQGTERLVAGPTYADAGIVFAQADGTPYHPDYVTKWFTRVVRDSGLPRMRFHDLRHLAASLRLATGADLSVVSKQLGHSTVALTSDTYSHLIGTIGRTTSQAAADLLDGTA